MPQTFTTGTGNAINGVLNAQSWGILKISATGWTGISALVTQDTIGLGIAGGRHSPEIDYNATTGATETLRLDFGGPVDTATVRLSRQSLAEAGYVEYGAWRAYDSTGTLVGQGDFDPRSGAPSGPNFDYTVNPASDFKFLDVFARPYSNLTTLGGWAESSDFSINQVTWTTASTAGPAAPLVVDQASSLTGSLNSQSWGGLRVSATNLAGAAALVSKSDGGIGVAGGRFAGQIDHDLKTGATEVLRIDFNGPVDAATLRLGRMFPNESGNAEVGAWKAYGSTGSVIGQGILDPRTVAAVASGIYQFTIDPLLDMQRLELTARPYNNTARIGKTGDGSDYSLVSVTYVPADVAPPEPAGMTVQQTGGATAVAEGGTTDSFTIALTSRPTANVTIGLADTADLDFGVAGGSASANTILTFTPDNWSVAQTVTVAAMGDGVVEGTETFNLIIDPASADGRYAALAAQTVAISIADAPAPPPQPPPVHEGQPTGSILVAVGSNIQAMVNAAGSNAVFWLEAGEHRMQSITPKSGQTFLGEDGAILNGSRELTGFTQNGSTWSVGGQTQEGERRATAEGTDGFVRAGYPDAVYLDDQPLRPVDSVGAVRSGTYFFDYAADRIYIGDNPAGRSVEAAVTPFAFSGNATGVEIRNLTVEKYATPIQYATVGGWRPPVDWLIEDNEVRLNYGVGISAGSGTEVRGNSVHDNGQMGVGASGSDILFLGNDIARNGFWSGIEVYWEGGGSKFSETSRLVVRDNFVHDNNGMGLWTDINNVNTLYEGNRIKDNSGAGISHEISYAAVIRNNTLVGNGSDGTVWLWGGGIQIQNSRDVEVYGNRVDMTNGGNGITLIQQNRGNGSLGPWVTENNWVHDNVVISRSQEGATGAVADYNQSAMLNGGNRFDYNQYSVTNASDDHWAWGSFYNWSQYRAASGWDAHSTVTLI